MSANPEFTRADMVQALGNFRRKLQFETDGENLLNITASVGMFLFDVTEALRLTDEEKEYALGAPLLRDIFVSVDPEPIPELIQ